MTARPEPCTTPAKLRYATPVTARRAALEATALYGEPHWPYPCRCGWWHTSTKPYDRKLGVDRNGTVYRRRQRATRSAEEET